MIIKNSQQDVIIDIESNIDTIALKISGGADSAILCYILGLYKKQFKPDLKINTITSVCMQKEYQDIFATKVISKVEELLDIKFNNRYVNLVSPYNYVEDQRAFVKSLESNYQLLFIGETKNPPVLLSKIHAPPTGRDGNNMPTKLGKNRMPFKNINKKGIKELYDTLGVIDTIFPLTRSCENFTNDFTIHCGLCWFCLERQWGFGKL